jgi:peptidoglycan/LPS O-acetylase OafA/YrhL
VFLAVNWVPRHELTGSLRFSAFFLIEFLFVIGGFVALLPVLASGGFEGVRSYALRRAGRLLPLYYLALLLAILLGPTLRPVSGASSPHDLWAVMAHAGFLQHEIYPYRAGFGIQGVVWVLSIVAAFYVLFPLVAERWVRHPFIALGAAAAVAVAWREALRGEPAWFLQFPLFFIDFAVGMTAAHIYVRRMRPGRMLSSREALPWFILALVALVPLLYLSGRPVLRQEGSPWGEHWLLALLVPSVFASVLLLAPLLPRWARLPFDNRAARFLGKISYGVFMFHFMVIWAVLRVVDIPRNGSPASVLKLAVIVVPITILCAWLGTEFVEGPIRRRAQRRAARLEPRPAPEPRPDPVPAAT